MSLKRTLKIGLATLVILIAALVFMPVQTEAQEVEHVFFFIGDGLGNAQATLTEYYLQDKYDDPDYELNMHRLDEMAVTTTYGADKVVPGSAQTATALASGHKTNFGYVGVTTDHEPTTTIMDKARENDWGTGLVTTTRVTHATPAAFASHVPDRGMENEIIEHYLEKEVDVIAGGGYRHLYPEDHPDSTRTDDRNMYAEFAEAGYNTFEGPADVDEFRDFDPEGRERILAGFHPTHMSYEIDRDSAEEPSLAEMTDISLNTLEEYGEFMMVIEGGRIDHAAHNNDPGGMIYDTIAFDEAIGVALEFYEENPDNTLIIVAGDHETGGLGLNSCEGMEYGYYLDFEPVFAQEASIEEGIAFEDEEQWYQDIADKFGLDELTPREQDWMEHGVAIEEEYGHEADVGRPGRVGGVYDGGQDYDVPYDDDALTEEMAAHWPQAPWISPAQSTLAHIVSRRAKIGWNTSSHTGSAIQLTAHGAGASNYEGRLDNTDVATITAGLLDFELDPEVGVAEIEEEESRNLLRRIFGR
ncbi:alkaline phosphatase [Halanaerobium hydrogeniformans]|uniref:Alkaline phosphatase n=1 Tax=Halanaerobium hydrogeniformans TaxID=656519 RepID=E4RLK1_HALHG|nr:alkaline phosphatase [Halanaerobium hydrogeniformans]ADQ14915.1 Alkaline phosphatase [Halanaerobium hydrogeniformans]